MNLHSMTVQGYRRFVTRSSIRLNERLIALVGPNEAGKSSILNALAHSGTDKPFDVRDCPRRRTETVEIELIYRVTDGDRAAMAGIPGAAELRRCKIIKKMDGVAIISLEPEPPHDLSQRKRVLEILEAAATQSLLAAFGSTAEERQQRIQRLTTAIGALKRATADYLGKSTLGQLTSVLESDLRALERNPKSAEADRALAKEIANEVDSMVKHEQDCAPERIRNILLKRRPPMLTFDLASRELAASYDLNAHAPNPPAALGNLCRLCKLDLQELLTAAAEKNIDRRDEILEVANQALREVFSARWIHDGVVPQLAQDGRQLYINVRTGVGATALPITDRSDGLRWFVALIAFLCGRTSEEKPILLVDEAETHLSYDAQASLIDVLETQDVAQKVIYTTHSAGCLPSDLGSGVRSIRPVTGDRSEVTNSFWYRGVGFSPLLMSMGLSPFAFTVARNVLIAEGPSECVLLPSLLREVTGLEQLHFQVAPGASTVGSAGVDELIMQSERGAFVLDGDAAGDEIRAKLKEAGVREERIKTYRDLSGRALTFEDLVSPEAYVEAYNGELHLWTPTAPSLGLAEIGEMDRANETDAWCAKMGLKPVGKVFVCQALAQMAADGRTLVRPECREILLQLHKWAMGHFRHAAN